MNIHTYGVPLQWPLLRRGYLARAVMAAYGDVNRPMWNTEFGIDAGNLWAARKHTTGQQFDQGQLGEWRTTILEAQRHGLFWKILPYQFHTGNERGLDTEAVELPEGHTIDDYGFGILRRDGKTPRPTYEWLLEAQVNRDLRDRPRFTTDVEVQWDGSWEPDSYEFETGPGRIKIRDVRIDVLEPTEIRLRSP